jgi:hypothetical protein
MTLRELFDLHRNKYVDHFVDLMNQTEGGNFEVLLKYDENQKEIDLYNYYRPDCLKINSDGNKILEFQNETYLNHEVFSLDFNGLELLIYPLLWDNVEIEMVALPENMEFFYNWIRKWIDIEDKKVKNEKGLQEVIHSIHQTRDSESNNIIISIDFGTAPGDALSYLLDAFQKGGIRKVLINSSNV